MFGFAAIPGLRVQDNSARRLVVPKYSNPLIVFWPRNAARDVLALNDPGRLRGIGHSHATLPRDDKIESLRYGAAAGMLNAHNTIAVWAMRFQTLNMSFPVLNMKTHVSYEA
jgi:hypothetical protein